MKRSDLSLLNGLLKRMDDKEALLQDSYGDAEPRSIRVRDKKEAEALRAALKELGSDS